MVGRQVFLKHVERQPFSAGFTIFTGTSCSCWRYRYYWLLKVVVFICEKSTWNHGTPSTIGSTRWVSRVLIFFQLQVTNNSYLLTVASQPICSQMFFFRLLLQSLPTQRKYRLMNNWFTLQTRKLLHRPIWLVKIDGLSVSFAIYIATFPRRERSPQKGSWSAGKSPKNVRNVQILRIYHLKLPMAFLLLRIAWPYNKIFWAPPVWVVFWLCAPRRSSRGRWLAQLGSVEPFKSMD